MIERWKEFIGRRIVVDYTTNNGMMFFAKGFLDAVDTSVKMILITSEDSEEQWYISESQIKNLKIKDVDLGEY
jgi:transcription termination factor Rho